MGHHLRITASLIVRDEERYLDGCLASLQDFVDDIVIVDTGSQDCSPDIARSHGAQLYFLPWQDDFALARNAALEKSNGDWILYIDADERLVADEAFHSYLDDSTLIAARVRFRASRQLTPYREYRLFRNRPEIRFRGIIHETIMPDIQTLIVQEGANVIDVPVGIDHLGYEGDLQRKHQRNLNLIKRALADNPTRIYLWHALGECHLGLGNATAAEQAWRQGLAYVRNNRTRPGNALIYSNLFNLHFNFSDVEIPDIDSLMNEACEYHPNDPLILWWSAQQLATSGNFQQARATLTRLLNNRPNELSSAQLGYDSRLFDEFACGLMGTCWLQENQPEHALGWLDQAYSINPDNIEIKTKRQYAYAQLHN